jgi:hypothetical protein
MTYRDTNAAMMAETRCIVVKSLNDLLYVCFG